MKLPNLNNTDFTPEERLYAEVLKISIEDALYEGEKCKDGTFRKKPNGLYQQRRSLCLLLSQPGEDYYGHLNFLCSIAGINISRLQEAFIKLYKQYKINEQLVEKKNEGLFPEQLDFFLKEVNSAIKN